VDWVTLFKPISLVVIGICVSTFGCRRPTIDDLTIWKAEVRSPDGLLIASVRTIQNGGFGSAKIDTVVYLKQSFSSQPPVDVLDFDCHDAPRRPYVLDNANAGGTIDLTMKWVTPSHLQVTYDRHPDLYFQAVKAFGVNISVQDLSSEPTDGKDSK
jgi:hypothetical protein